MKIEKQQLEVEYQKYIYEIAEEYIKTHTINENLVKAVNSIQAKIRDLDILEAIKDVKKKEHDKTY